MVCDDCQRLFEGEIHPEGQSGKDWYKVDELECNVSDLFVANGCALCYRIFRELAKIVPDLLKDPAAKFLIVGRKLLFHAFDMVTGDLIFDFSFPHDASQKAKASYRLSAVRDVRPDLLIRKRWRDIKSEARNDSDSTFELARTWLRGCVEGHRGCETSSEFIQPSRLLELSAIDEKTVYLRETAPMQSRPAYVTLSHCWGNAEFLTLTSKTYSRLHDGIEIDSLAQTFQDAIQVARELGVSYIWIDSLCIFQDSKEDWQKEAPLMAAIYKGSLCNIGACASQTSNDGLFRTRDPRFLEPIVVKTFYANEPLLNSEYLIEEFSYRSIPHEHNQQLFSRGWVFQERILAPRMLNFGDEYVFWQCKTDRYSEIYPHGYPCGNQPGETSVPAKVPVNGDLSKEARSVIWWNAVESYSKLALTCSSDKLVAIAGVAQHLQTLGVADTYIAGMWQSTFSQSLLWFRISQPHPSFHTAVQARPLPYRAPTWSWASVDKAVGQYDPKLDDFMLELCTFQSATLHNLAPSIYSELSAGFLRMRGMLLSYTFIEDPIARYAHEKAGPSFRKYPVDMTLHLSYQQKTLREISLGQLYLYISADNNLALDTVTNEIVLCPLNVVSQETRDRVDGLVLHRTKVGKGRDKYERCGMFNVRRISEGDYTHTDHSMCGCTFWSQMTYAMIGAANRKNNQDDNMDGGTSFPVEYKVGPRLEDADEKISSETEQGDEDDSDGLYHLITII